MLKIDAALFKFLYFLLRVHCRASMLSLLETLVLVAVFIESEVVVACNHHLMLVGKEFQKLAKAS